MRILVTGGSGFIGTNLVAHFLETNVSFRNLDRAEPKLESHRPHWIRCDILEPRRLVEELAQYQPTCVIHLAARTDVEGKSLDDYHANTAGTANVLQAVRNTRSVERLVITSTQYVNQYNGCPKHDEDYAPHTVYGQSKVITEQLTRQANLRCVWTIVRPTNIWGPWHPRYPFEFWRTLASGLYLHPGTVSVFRAYGYVGNVVYQLMRILDAPQEKVHGRVYYLGDPPIDLFEWVNGFSLSQTDRRVRVAPRKLVAALAIVGDLLKLVSIRFPITSSRFKNMITENGAPMGPTFELCGTGPYALEQGIRATTDWMKKVHPGLVKVQNRLPSRGQLGCS